MVSFRTMAEVEWTNESVVQLVEEYQRLPELWDRSHELHTVQTAKYEAWTSLARTFGCDIADLRKKITSVLASYRREKGKVRKGLRSSWFLYPHLKFLSGYLNSPGFRRVAPVPEVEPNQMHSIEPESMDQDEENDGDDDDQDHVVTIKQEPAVEPPPPPKRTTFASQKHSRRLIRTKRPVSSQREGSQSTHTDSKLLEMLRLLKKSDISKKKDECDSFGEYIATSLRKHDDRTQSMIKQAINNILFEQEMKKYSTYTVLISPENPLGNVTGDDLDDVNDDKTNEIVRNC